MDRSGDLIEMPSERERAKFLVEKLPSSIRIGAYDFTIQKWDAPQAMGARRWGECSIAELTLRIQRDMPSRVKAVDTFVHEVCHATWWAFCVEDEDKEERTVNTLMTGWVSVYRDNPWLLDWIKEGVSA